MPSALMRGNLAGKHCACKTNCSTATMPLIVITGTPSSGKTTRARELREYFERKRGKKVEIISESESIAKAGYDKNIFYSDSKKEKGVRSDVKSNAQRLLNPADVLIVDAANYIKGYRYEIYCMSKLYKTPQCTLQCELPVEHAWLLNEERPETDRYSRETFDALVMRYETPDNRNRWDSPLFVVTPHDLLPFDDIYNALYEVKAPKPNMSTQCAPLSSTNYLYELDKITQEIVNAILAAEQMGVTSDIKIPGHEGAIVERSGNASQLSRLRRQFLTYSKMHQIETSQIAHLFAQYLNKSL